MFCINKIGVSKFANCVMNIQDRVDNIIDDQRGGGGGGGELPLYVHIYTITIFFLRLACVL